jgi:DNA-binding NtrC family response regulator
MMRHSKILIVEDELIARENLDHVLTKEGYDTVAVESGALAFKELEKEEFDLVMTDLRMQQVDGLQVLERTKELYPDTEVIMITGFATVTTAVEAMQKGAYHYLPKPYKIEGPGKTFPAPGSHRAEAPGAEPEDGAFFGRQKSENRTFETDHRADRAQ